MLSPEVQKILDAIIQSINKSTGLGHPNDLEKAVEALGKAVDAGFDHESPGDIYNYAKSKGVLDEGAMDIEKTYDVLKADRKKEGGQYFKDEFYEGVFGK